MRNSKFSERKPRSGERYIAHGVSRGCWSGPSKEPQSGDRDNVSPLPGLSVHGSMIPCRRHGLQIYNMERQELKGYSNYIKLFERNGKYSGGAPGLDY
jgi:hypothetical protein